MNTQPQIHQGLLLVDFFCLNFKEKGKEINPAFLSAVDGLRALDVKLGIFLLKPLPWIRTMTDHALLRDFFQSSVTLVVSGEECVGRFKTYTSQEILDAPLYQSEAGTSESYKSAEDISPLFRSTISDLKERFKHIGFLSKGDHLRIGRRIEGIHSFTGEWARGRMRRGGRYLPKGSYNIEKPEDLSWVIREKFKLSLLTLPMCSAQAKVRLVRVLGFPN